MDFTASTVVTLLVVIGFLALIVSIITEVTKGVAILQKIPANLQVIVLSLSLTLVSYFAYISYNETAIVWYYIVADIIAGFVVAYVALYGWGKLADLYKKFRNIPTFDINTNTSTAAKAITQKNPVKASAENTSIATTPETPIPVSSNHNLAETSITDMKATVLPVLETIVDNVMSIAAGTKSLSPGIFAEENSTKGTLTVDSTSTDITESDIVTTPISSDTQSADTSKTDIIVTDIITDAISSDALPVHIKGR